MSGSSADAEPEPLLREEIVELATVYNAPGPAEVLLLAAGYPADAMPYAPKSPREYWETVSANLATGVMADGRRRILAEARERRPFNPVFAAAPGPGLEVAATAPATATATGTGTGTGTGVPKVMVLGSEPARRGAVRAAAELREILQAARDRLQVVPGPAATSADLVRIRRELPDILHLACHGTEEGLLLEDQDGEPHTLPAAELARTLQLATEHYGHHLRALVLRSCDSDVIAGRFTELADVVIAHRGRLDADCSTLFAAAFYEELAALPDPLTRKALVAAAHVAAQDVVNRAGVCRSISTDLIVLTRTS
ncbi:effector-associated domain EAD1-containing protein [Streptomyces sp. NPDC097617]|uniref:effector-associated domain EAD1-containing protein n=1 Tax=Streptomyces sp. NPDC097617 TaxID=3366091 RepID=UPI003801640F